MMFYSMELYQKRMDGMDKDKKDNEAENMTDLVKIINSNNNSRKINKILEENETLPEDK